MKIWLSMCFLGMIAILHAGEWSVQSTVFSGSASGTSTHSSATNTVNGVDITSSNFNFPSGTTGLNMWSNISDPIANPSHAHAQSSSAQIVYTFRWTRSHKNDAPGPTLTVALDLPRHLQIGGDSESFSVNIWARAKAMGDGIQFPELNGGASGLGFDFGQTVDETVRLVKTLSVSNDQATLSVSLRTETEVDHVLQQFFGGGGGGTETPSSAHVFANSSITPSVSLLNIVLIIPEQGVYPATNPPNDNRNKYEFDQASPGVLLNPDWQSKVIGENPTQFLPNTTYTPFTIAGSTRTNDTKSISGDLIRQHFTYTGLPSANSSFGDKEVIMTCTSPVSTTQKAYVRVFFVKAATNHPLPPDAPNISASPTPNWFYYWSQTSAYYGQCKYFGNSPIGLNGKAFFLAHMGWVATVFNGAAYGPGSSFYGSPMGIDLFAWTCRHEERHRLDFEGFWGNSDRNATDDPDCDFIPTDRTQGGIRWIEANLTPPEHHSNHPTENYDPNDPSSVTDDVDYGEGFKDCEDYCRHRQATWINGSANEADWAHPGKQWWLNGSEI